MADHWAMGRRGRRRCRSRGSSRLIDLPARAPPSSCFTPDEMPLLEKVAHHRQGALSRQGHLGRQVGGATNSPTSRPWANGKAPGCGIAKTPVTASRPTPTSRAPPVDPRHPGPRGAAFRPGAEFVVGGLRRNPHPCRACPGFRQADMIDVGADGKIVGLF